MNSSNTTLFNLYMFTCSVARHSSRPYWNARVLFWSKPWQLCVPQYISEILDPGYIFCSSVISTDIFHPALEHDLVTISSKRCGGGGAVVWLIVNIVTVRVSLSVSFSKSVVEVVCTSLFVGAVVVDVNVIGKEVVDGNISHTIVLLTFGVSSLATIIIQPKIKNVKLTCE